MQLDKLWIAIYNRAAADNGTGGLFDEAGAMISGFYNIHVPSSTALPYVVYTVASCTHENAFSKDVYEVIVRMQVYVTRTSTAGTDPLLKLGQIIDRMYGNSSAGSTPTYGFARWKPTLSGSWTATALEPIDSIENHDDDTYRIIQQYRLWLSK